MSKNQIIKRVSDFTNWIGMGRIIASSVGVLVVISGGWWIMSSPPPPIEAGIAFAPSLVSNVATPPISVGVPPAIVVSASSPATITVHVAGEVQRPGVVEIAGSSRVVDAVAAAGGVTWRGDLDAVNLATQLVDAAQVYIPRRGETPKRAAVRPRPGLNPPTLPAEISGGGAAKSGATGYATVIDLNSATEQQLDTLPGVGPSTARAILAYRLQHGPFSRMEDLLNVRGIGPTKLEALRGLVRT